VCTKSERAELNIAAYGRAAFFARKDFETLLLVRQLSTTDGHILAHLEVTDLNLRDWLDQSAKPTLTTDEVFLGSSVDGMRKHNILAAMAFRKTEKYQKNVQDSANRNLLLVSADGSGLPGEDRRILTKLARQYVHVGDKHDSTYALGLEATRKATVTSMQATGIASKLMLIYWHHDPDSQWFGNWVLLHVTPNTNAGMTRATVHEVMHDTTIVKAKDPTSRMPPSARTAKIKCVHLGNVAAVARTKTVVFVSPKPMVLHGCSRGGVWDLTSHITCMASRPGPAGTDAQEGFQLRFNSVGRPVKVYLPPPTYQDALGFILQHLTPLAHERAKMPHDKQYELYSRLLRCEIQAQSPPDAVILNEIECNVTIPSGEHWVG